MAVDTIKFPVRAELVGHYADYQVFVEFWSELTSKIGQAYRRVSANHLSRIVGIYGAQGAGKTLLRDQINSSFTATKTDPRAVLDTSNIWHLISGGAQPSTEKIQEETRKSRMFLIDEGSSDWITEILRDRGTDKNTAIALADDVHNLYFWRTLLAADGQEHLLNDGLSDLAIQTAAQRLVRFARKDMQDTLIVLLCNDRTILERLQDGVDYVHDGLMEVVDLPQPTPEDKERVVRVNINLLNPVSYWYCLDSAQPELKKHVRRSFRSESTFPACFEAVDNAFHDTVGRTGRRGRKNLLSLVCLTPDESFASFSDLPNSTVDVEGESGWISVRRYETGWSTRLDDERKSGLLESEWSLRLVLLGAPFVRSLLSIDRQGRSSPCVEDVDKLLTLLEATLGHTSKHTERQRFKDGIAAAVAGWTEPDGVDDVQVDDFWSRGQNRSGMYERPLKILRSSYDTATPGFPSARPDLVVADYKPCGLSGARTESQQALNAATQRNAHAFEFTAFKELTTEGVSSYLCNKKLPTYLRSLEQL